MLRVDRPQALERVAAEIGQGAFDQVAAGDQRLLVGERHPTTAAQRGEHGGKGGHAGRRDHDDLGAVEGRELLEAAGSPSLTGEVARAAVVAPGPRIRPVDELGGELVASAAGGQSDQREMIAMRSDHLQRLSTDRTGRPEQDDPGHRLKPATSSA